MITSLAYLKDIVKLYLIIYILLLQQYIHAVIYTLISRVPYSLFKVTS